MPGAPLPVRPARPPASGRSPPGSGERSRVAAPEGLTLSRHRDLKGRERRPLARRLLLALLAALLALGPANVFGQRPSSSLAAAPAASLEVSAPLRLRSGLYFQARFRIRARRELRRAALVLHPDWLEGLTLNTVEPAPLEEGSRDGRVVLELGRVPAGAQHLLYLQFQVNPTAVGRRSLDVALEDGGRPIAAIERDARIWP